MDVLGGKSAFPYIINFLDNHLRFLSLHRNSKFGYLMNVKANKEIRLNAASQCLVRYRTLSDYNN